ncbi:hypothetical protein FOMPIDRAFT_1048510 [Fomitopsis schrenkii]|uniref:Uncharacterized protein n=1 Tax=Fomitopsis schrenkii TaxID=2126942 RepID=S8FTU8_FOMSC|nr:hypothetical protein FOMPIDRAFT_1048510 [Fomitopsis schrenkii]
MQEVVVTTEDEEDVTLNRDQNIGEQLAQLSQTADPGDSESGNPSRPRLDKRRHKQLAQWPSLTLAGRYERLGIQPASPANTSLLLPNSGPWKIGTNKVVVGALRILWFHIPWHRRARFYELLQQARENTLNHKHAIAEEDWIREGFAIPVLPLDRYQGELRGLLNNFLEHVQASFEIVVKRICSLWISDSLYQQLRALHNPEYYAMYIAYINRLTAKPQADFTRVIAALVEEMPSAMETKAVDRVIVNNAISMETWQNGTRVKIENESAALRRIEEARQDMEEAQQLLLKRKRPAEDEDGRDDSSSTSGSMQDSAGGTGGTSTMTQGAEEGSSSSAQNESGSALDTAGRTEGVTQGAADASA